MIALAILLGFFIGAFTIAALGLYLENWDNNRTRIKMLEIVKDIELKYASDTVNSYDYNR